MITTFLGLLKAIPPTDPVLVLGITDVSPDQINPQMLRDIFGFSRKNRFTINRPTRECREEFFQSIISYVRKAPNEFPDPINRKKRKLEPLKLAPPPPPRIPTKEEIKAQKKQDHQTLNLLKVAIQPIVDQIHRKYKKFRQPVLMQSEYQYLLDEMDPNFVRPDIPQSRRFELDVDKNGVNCLRETETGKRCYNLDTNMIEERLANGFYCRPKDFTADIRTLAKDAKNFGDKDRQLRTKELVANVEVDLDGIERDPRFADCENLYRRQLQRKKEAEKEKSGKRVQEVGLDLVRSDVFSGEGSSILTSPGVINLNQAISARRPVAAVSPFQTPTVLSNGHSGASGSQHNMTNGSSVPSRISGEDIMMSGTNDNASDYSQGSIALPRQQWPPKTAMASSSMSNRATGFNSQRSAFQEISHDTSLGALINNASPTTSGKRTSEATTSKRTSDNWSTQATNGTRPGASSPMDGHRQDADLPDTQKLSQNLNTHVSNVADGDRSSGGDSEWLHSQAHALARGHLGFASQTPSTTNSQEKPPVPQFNAPPRPSAPNPSQTGAAADDSLIEANSAESSQKEYIMTESYASELLQNLTDGSSGCSIEQLEQINRELMDHIWKMRGEWNRNRIFTQLTTVFNDTILDIEEMQKVLKPSQESPPQTPHSIRSTQEQPHSYRG